MEFACGYVYVPPSPSQKDIKRYANKRSPLLPPPTWVRPSTAPPAPPTDYARAKAQQTTSYENTISEDLIKGKQIKVVKPTAQNEKAECLKKLGTSSPKSAVSGLTPPQKTALLPPHMKPAASTDCHTQPLVSHNVNNQVFTYDYAIPEPDLNKQPTDPDYSYAIPEGLFSEVKLPADPGAVSTSTPPLPPRPQFMDYIPEYIMVLPSSSSSPLTPRSSPTPMSVTQPPAAKADDEPLMGNPNVVLVSLGKLLSHVQVQPTKETPTLCSQCGSVLESCYNNRVKDCCFCRLWDSNKSSAQNVYQDKLFLLNPDEPLLSASDTLLIFCIDASGSMSITFNVRRHHGEVTLCIRKS